MAEGLRPEDMAQMQAMAQAMAEQVMERGAAAARCGAMPSRAAEIRQRPPEESAPVLGWDDFLTYALDWRQDQHLAAVGPTGQGKVNDDPRAGRRQPQRTWPTWRPSRGTGRWRPTLPRAGMSG